MVTIKNKPSGTILSSSLSELIIESNNSYIDFSLRTVGDGIYLYQEKLWVYNGSASAYNLNEIIENYMREKGISVLWLQITAQYLDQHDVASVHIIYCENYDVLNGANDFATQNFLTSLQTRRVAPDSIFSLHLYSEESQREYYELKYFYKVQGSDVVRSQVSHGYSSDVSSNVYSIDINVSQLKSYAATDARVSASLIELVSFSVSCGNRYAVFFVDKSLQYGETFMFRNVFNAIDWITLPAVTNSKTDVERSIAVLPGKSAFYDRTVTKSYEIQTGPINQEEAEFLGQLAASNDVYKLLSTGIVNGSTQYAVKEILITDSDVSYSDSDETQSIKFTWRYADNRPPVLLADPARIFTKEYNKVFS